MKAIRTLSWLVLCGLLVACATLDPDWEDPTVTLTSFRALPSEGMAPSFEVGLRIINPNRQELAIEGIVYTISLNGRDVIKGVGKDYPVIEGYSEGEVTVTASANLFEGFRLFTDMASGDNQSIEYAFEAKLDLGGLYPSLKIRETGNLNNTMN